jgi:hypothetical protein
LGGFSLAGSPSFLGTSEQQMAARPYVICGEATAAVDLVAIRSRTKQANVIPIRQQQAS